MSVPNNQDKLHRGDGDLFCAVLLSVVNIQGGTFVEKVLNV
jgi:hypothetical protein